MNAKPNFTHVVSGLVGAIGALLIAGLLVAVGVIHTGGTGTSAPVVQAALKPTNENATSKTISQIYDEASPGVVFIQSEGVQDASPFGGGGEGVAEGSGFVLDEDGDILTNAHVVEGADRVTVQLGPDDDPIVAHVVGSDPSSDLAVLKVDASQAALHPLPLGDSNDVKVGDAAIAIGNPFGFDRTVTTGIISALQRELQAPNGFSIDDVLQTDAAINPGNSGGPLLDANGNVIGINSQIVSNSTGAQGQAGSVGIGFAVPINTAKAVVPDLEKNGEVERAFLGVTTTAVTQQLADDLNLPRDSGAMVQDVVPNGPSDKAGIRAGHTKVELDSMPGANITAGGDQIVKVDGATIGEPADVAAAIADKKPGDSVQVSFYRGDQIQTVTVVLGKRPASAQSITQPQGGKQELPPGLPFP
ncbi:MAG: hypothetical protein QOG62_2749 [Thermoleophilaceae bacterium]|jgi:S1-C subfamily serine protease|nr:hypothetical protein [Thermoleophilaceae bacterium]